MKAYAYLRERIRRKGLLDATSSVLRRFKQNRASRLLSEIARFRYLNTADAPTLRTIQIETLAYCNLRCSFCPTNQVPMPKGHMSVALFKHLIDQLAEFEGTLGLYLRNEPLLDKRIVSFARLAKDRTKATVFLQTNGVLLDERLASELSEVARIQVNDYSGGKELVRLSKLMERYNIVGVDRSNPQGLSNRAGNLPGAKVPSRAYPSFCVRPFDQMYIAFDGRAVLCCQDWLLEEVMGNAQHTPLADIWQCAVYRKKRNELLARSRCGLCASCDFPGV